MTQALAKTNRQRNAGALKHTRSRFDIQGHKPAVWMKEKIISDS